MPSLSPAVLDRVVDGRYRVDALLARGGMASVYEAEDLRLERKVAMKVMHADLANDDAFVQGFRREALAAAKLSHPNVVGVFDQGQDSDVVFLVMELVRGHTLREVIREQAPVTAREAVRIIDALLAALAAAHKAGIVHRDVKPENVLIDGSGHVKVADFGLARAVTTSTKSRSDELTWGTAAYLAPEQVEFGRADSRSDVYAAALLLYELLTGVKAFPGHSPLQVAYQHVHGQVPNASASTSTVPAELDAFIQHAAATAPGERPVDASEARALLARAVRQLSDGELDQRADVGTGQSDLTTDFGALATNTTRDLRRDQTTQVPRVDPADGGYARRSGKTPARRGTTTARPMPHTKADAAQKHPRRRGRLIGLVVLFLLLLGGGSAAGWYWTAGPGAHSAMPAVVGTSEQEAITALEAAELEPVTSQDYSESVPAGDVLAASSQEGEQVRHGTEVELTISQGPERYDVPELTGLTSQEAQQELEGNNLALGSMDEEWDEEMPEGQVLTAEPAAGESVPPDTAVDLTVSAGPEPLEIPDTLGLPENEAVSTLEEIGFEVQVADEQVFDDEVAAGSVVEQSPIDDTAFRGDTVTITISKGPELVEVPRVVGQQWEEAKKALEDLGFTVERSDLAGGYFGTVRFQSADPGEELRKGETITLTVL